MPVPTAFFLDLDWARVRGAYERAGVWRSADSGELGSVGHALAGAIAASPGWRDFPRGTVVFRDGSPPMLGILFEEQVSDTRSLEVRAAQLPLSLELLRFRSWEDVTEDAAVLADQIRAELGDDGVRQARWVAIPRGGRIVLGLLSYLLDLPPSPPAVDDAPVVIVDDCILSGRRLQERLSDLEIDPDSDARREKTLEVFVATLYSNPAARESVAAQESSIKRIYSAHDLEDHAAEVYGEDVEAWKERWSSRTDAEGVWIGLPDHVCFPWNEPDTGLWNGTDEIRAWRVLPSEICMKNRARCGESLESSVMADEGGYLVPCSDVLVGPVGESLVVASRGTGRSAMLSGSASDMWEVSIRAGDRGLAARELTSRFGVDEAVVRHDLERFEARLIEAGFVEYRW